ncbi:MAG TPA: phosphotransferase [Anaerolineales bacterium]|nr:phosphotransferase [Anaerolineales bacterium]
MGLEHAAMAHAGILRAFGFQFPSDEVPESIYSYAPVYRLRNESGEWIVKRAQKPLARGRAVAAWAGAAAAKGIRLVTPAAGFGENPRAFEAQDGSEEVWVVYPFVRGNPYTGEKAQIEAAGSLLGQIHALDYPGPSGLKIHETVVAVEEAEIEGDIQGILAQVRRVFPAFGEAAGLTLSERCEQYFRHALPRMLETRLPLAICSWDYKASNLIYPEGDAPVLVDVDNAGCIPRLYDLAIALLLFHNDGGHAPGLIFTPAEWTVFLEAYARHVQLTADERQTWEAVLLCAWVDEGLWLLNNDEEGWADPRQFQMLLSLLHADLSCFILDSEIS